MQLSFLAHTLLLVALPGAGCASPLSLLREDRLPEAWRVACELRSDAAGPGLPLSLEDRATLLSGQSGLQAGGLASGNRRENRPPTGSGLACRHGPVRLCRNLQR